MSAMPPAIPSGTATPDQQVSLFAGAPRFPTDVRGADVGDCWGHLIQRHGAPQAAGQVAGDFAVAMALPDGSIFLAVDRFGVRPLYWRVEQGRLRFAARADALGASELDPQAIFDYLYFHVVPSPRSVFDGVSRMPPGHWGLFRDGRMTVQPYWTPEFRPTERPDFGALKEEFQSLLLQAVRRQLDGSRPACFLSGGTDSSTITGMAAKASDQTVVAYSIGFEADGYDEMSYARLAARHFQVEHRALYYTQADLLRDIPKVAAGYDQPFGNSSALPSFFCAGKAHEEGVSRMLAGDGGDELFGGNSRYATQRLFDHYQRVPAFLRHGVLEPFFGLGLVARIPGLKKGSSYIRQARTPLPDRAQDYNLLRRLGYAEMLTPAMLALVDPASVDAQQQAVWAQARCVDEIDRHLAYDWRYTLAEADLPKVVGTTALAGVSVGFPMLDDDLLAFSMKLPADYKLRGPALRWFFKEALRDVLPADILTKKKQGFGLPFGVWMVEHAGLKRLAGDALDAIVARGVVRQAFIRRLLDEQLPQYPHYYGTMVWVLIMLEYWLRHHAPDWRLPA